MLHSTLILLPWLCMLATYLFVKVAERKDEIKRSMPGFTGSLAYGITSLIPTFSVMLFTLIVCIICAVLLILGY